MSISSKEEPQIQSAYQGVNFLEDFFFFQFPKSPPANTHIQISQVLGEICFEFLYPESQKPSLYPYQTEPTPYNFIWKPVCGLLRS